MLKRTVVLFLVAAAILVVASTGRSIVSRQRGEVDARVVSYSAQPGDEARNLPLGGDLTVALPDGRTVEVPVSVDRGYRPGQTVRLSERVAPWREVWYRLAN